MMPVSIQDQCVQYQIPANLVVRFRQSGLITLNAMLYGVQDILQGVLVLLIPAFGIIGWNFTCEELISMNELDRFIGKRFEHSRQTAPRIAKSG